MAKLNMELGASEESFDFDRRGVFFLGNQELELLAVPTPSKNSSHGNFSELHGDAPQTYQLHAADH